MDSEILNLIKSNELLNSNRELLTNVSKNLDERIEKEDPRLVRAQISSTFQYIKEMTRLVARAEMTYRITKSEAVDDVARELKSDKAKAKLDGNSATDRYARDLVAGYLRALEGKLSALKTILSSLNTEMKEFTE
jgi:hypothetical protein